MPQIHIDENAKRILDKEKENMKNRGMPGASLGDAVRSLAARAVVADDGR